MISHSRFPFHTLQISCVGLVLLGAACSRSYDLGSEPVEEVAVNEVNPTWENGIGQLMTSKCGNCHVPRPGPFVPPNTPLSFDFTQKETTTSFRCRVAARTLEGNPTPMPPDFATPLTAREKAALKAYLATLPPCETLTPAGTETSLTYDDVKGSLVTDCASAGCHVQPGAAANYDLSESNKETILTRTYADKALSRIADGSMPLGRPQWKDSEAGKKVIEWLRGGKDIK